MIKSKSVSPGGGGEESNKDKENKVQDPEPINKDFAFSLMHNLPRKNR